MKTRSPRGTGAANAAVFIALLLASLGIGGTAAAQATSHRRTVVALSDSMPVANAKAILLFHAPPSGDNVILLPRRTVSPLALGAAFKVLGRMEREYGGFRHSAMVPIEGVLPPANIAADDIALLRTIVAEVSQQPRTRIGGVGPGQWMPVARSRTPFR